MLLHWLPYGAPLGRIRAQDIGVLEVATSLRSGWHKCVDFHGVVLRHSFKINEKKRFFLPDGSAQRKPVLIPGMVRLWNSLCIVEKVVGIEGRPLAEPPTTAMKLVSSFFENYVYHRTAVVSELCREAVVLHLEFLNNFHGRLIVDVRCCALSLLGCASQGTVDPNFSRRVSLSIGNKICASRIRIRSALSRGFRYAAGEEYESEKAAVGQRDISNVFVRYICAKARIAGIQQRSLRAYAHGLRNGLRRKGEIQRCLLTHPDCQSPALLRRQIWRLNPDRILRRTNPGEDIDSTIVRLRRIRYCRRLVR